MKILRVKRIQEFCQKHPQALKPFRTWLTKTESANWQHLNALKETFASADYVRPDHVVFNVGGNKYRLIAAINYELALVLVEKVFTHAEYDKWKA